MEGDNYPLFICSLGRCSVGWCLHNCAFYFPSLPYLGFIVLPRAIHYFEGGHYYTMQCIICIELKIQIQIVIFSLYSFGVKYEKDLLLQLFQGF